jgi:DNA-binding transcriptional LysR family regulator
MDLFQSMKVFAKVAECGSLSGAARALDMSNPSVTRHVADLETHLNARLFNRSTRRLSLTETGAAYLERCKRLLFDIEEATLAARASALDPSGTLRINAPLSFSINHLGRVLPQYAQRYPKVQLDVTLSDRIVDLVDEGFDLAIRISRIPDSALVARRLAPARLLVCAAPVYLERHGVPRTPQDLEQHVCLGYSYMPNRNEWQFERDGKVEVARIKGPLQANNGHLLRDAALAGMGIVREPSFNVGDDIRAGTLVRLLPDYQASDLGIYAVYPSRQHLSAKVRTFVDFLIGQFGDDPYWDRGL